jgi:hypothetical protein
LLAGGVPELCSFNIPATLPLKPINAPTANPAIPVAIGATKP